MINAENIGSLFDQWAEYIIKGLIAESSLAGLLLKHKGELGDAREALIDGVLSRVLPSAYEIGSGEIIDAYGGRSKQIDIVISRRDAPSLLLPSGSRLYLVESVLATIGNSVRRLCCIEKRSSICQFSRWRRRRKSSLSNW